MTKTLQKRFVITAMIAISILLTVLLGAINVANIVLVNRQIDGVMSVLTAGQGAYAPPDHRPQQTQTPNFRFPQRPSPDDMMGARYFSVHFDAEGSIVRTNINQIYAVTEDQANEIAAKLYKKGAEGRYQQFCYQTTTLPENRGSLMLFLDISTQQDSIVTVLLASCGGGLLCWIAMLALVIHLSRRAIAPIAQNIEKQKQFVTNAGHEIKTPLAIILANTDAMDLHNGENKWSRNIRAQTVRLNGLMQNLLTLSRMDESGVTLPMIEFSLDLLLAEMVQPYRETAQVRTLSFQTDIQPSAILKGNRDSIQQLVSILLDNAVKYTPEGGVVRVRLSKSGDKAALQVTNTCLRPPEEDLERLFDRFYRGDAARTQSSGGYGIGLSAARAIAQVHGGTITANYDSAEKLISFTALL